MPSPKHTLCTRWAPALALFGTLALPGIARADFQITYLFTDADGSPRPQLRLTTTDMSSYSNQASCQCGHLWGARVFLNRAMGESYPLSTQIRTYVGSMCDVGQNSIGQQQFPCVKVFEGLANNYDDGGILIPFEQLWLSSRVTSLSMQTVESAEPRLPCSGSQVGGGGIWICVESNGQPDCQSDEFVIKGDQSVNASTGGSTGSTGGTGMDGGTPSATNIQFDYIPPQSTVSGFRAEPGDGAVIIAWDRTEVPDVSGFRVLCVDENGDPPVTKITGVPTGRSRTNGKLYYTAENLCPGDVKYEPDPNEVPTATTTTSGSDTGRDTDLTSSDSTASAIDDPWLGDGWSMATTGTGTGTGTGGDSGTTAGTGSGTDSGTISGSGTDSGSDSGSGTDTGETIDSDLASLDWKYVCSDHVAYTGTTVRVEGLENGKAYEFIVVAYDTFGNPRIMSPLLTATPAETSDFWEQCEEQDDLCGSGGFCNCHSEPAPMGAAWFGAGLLGLGLARRRRRRAR